MNEESEVGRLEYAESMGLHVLVAIGVPLRPFLSLLL